MPLRAWAWARKPRPAPPNRNASHTTPLTILAEFGVVGFALYAWLLVAAAWALVLVAKKDRLLGLGLAALLLVLVTHSLLYAGFFEDPVTWGVLAVTAAVVIAAAALVTTYTLRLRSARNEALAEARRTRQIQDFMNGLLSGDDADAGPSDTLRVVVLLERGATQAGQFAAEPAIQCELYQTIGTMFRLFGRTAEADSMLSARSACPVADHQRLMNKLWIVPVSIVDNLAFFSSGPIHPQSSTTGGGFATNPISAITF